MTVSLNIQNDAELRAYIKDLIKGQVTALVREEIKEVLQDVLTKKISNNAIPNIEYLVKSEIKNIVQSEIGKSGYSGYNDTGFIKLEARRVVNEMVAAAFKNSNILV